MPRSYIGELLCKQMRRWRRMAARIDPEAVGTRSGPVHRLGLPRHPGGAGVSRGERSMPATSRRMPSPSPSATSATTAWRSASRCRGPTCSPPMPATATISSWPIRPTSSAAALAAFPARVCGRAEHRPCRRRGRPRYRAPHPGRGGRPPDRPRARCVVEVGTGRDILEERVSPACRSCGWTRPRARARCSCCRQQPCADAT